MTSLHGSTGPVEPLVALPVPTLVEELGLVLQ